MIRKRTKARRLALQLLFAIENSSSKPEDVQEVFWQERKNIQTEIKDFAQWLVNKTLSRLDEIDKRIINNTENWKLDRLACIDKNILRMAICEIIEQKTPIPVIINEAVELAKLYSTDESYKFVNGILDKMQ